MPGVYRYCMDHGASDRKWAYRRVARTAFWKASGRLCSDGRLLGNGSFRRCRGTPSRHAFAGMVRIVWEAIPDELVDREGFAWDGCRMYFAAGRRVAYAGNTALELAAQIGDGHTSQRPVRQ